LTSLEKPLTLALEVVCPGLKNLSEVKSAGAGSWQRNGATWSSVSLKNEQANSALFTAEVESPPGIAPPRFPIWNRVFDYAEPDLQREYAFVAVNPFLVTKEDPFTVASFTPPSDVGQKKEFEIARCDRQGEFDNLHIHPYVGFDDPAGAGKTGDQTKSMVEAPIAADECIHLHWR
jgi:hypothetical protein